MNARGNVPVAATLGLALLVSALLGCAAEGDNSASPAERPTGTVNILFTDAPSDDFSAINVTISRIELLPFNDDDADSDTDADDSDLSSNDGDSDSDRPNRRAMLFSGDATFDLLRLENFTNLFSITPNVPSGEYRKIRLTVSALELIDADTGLPILLDVPGNGKIDLLSRSPFLVEPDTTLLVTIDIDAKRSIHVSADDEDGYRFRPVVFVSVNNAPSDPGNPGETGDPPDPGDPGDPGVPAEVPVKFVRVQGFMNRSDLANGSFGMQVPNIGGEQFNIEMQTGAPVILSTGNLAAQNFEVSDNLSTAVGSFDENDPRLFRAVILNVGFIQDFVYTTLRGIAQSAPVDGKFDFTPEGGATISVALHPQAVFFDNAGNPSGIQAIKLDTPLEIDVRPAGGLQQATLIVALTADVQPQQQLAGQVVGVTGDVVTVATDLGDRCVRVGTATISLHTESSAGIDIGPGGIPDVQVGTTIDAVGIEDGGGCLQAQSVMVFTTAI